MDVLLSMYELTKTLLLLAVFSKEKKFDKLGRFVLYLKDKVGKEEQ
jgi:hypothetical protein